MPQAEIASNGYVDLQINGYVGVDFNNPEASAADLKKAALAMRAAGVAIALPTLITGSIEDMCRCIRNLRSVIEGEAEVAAIFRGLHLEGPFLSPVKGYIGAHPPQHALAQDLTAMEKLLDTAGELARIVTLAPESDPGGKMTALCVERGIVVAAGHTDTSLQQLDDCLDAGLSLFTHFGNGCPNLMHRHDNVLYRALSRVDRLRYTLIADGFHLPELLFRNLLGWIPRERISVVSDAISAAGLGPGTYQLAGLQIEIGPDRVPRAPSGEHFVGSACDMRDADRWLEEVIGLSAEERRQLLTDQPRAWLGL